MACKRVVGSTESILLAVINNLSPIDIYDATRKSADNFYKCSSPNNIQQLHHDDALALDMKLLEVGKEAMFFPRYKAALMGKGEPICPKERFMNLSKEVGELAEALKSSNNTDVSLKEAEDVQRAIASLIHDLRGEG